MHLLKLIRWKNLLMIALVQLLIKYALLEPFGVSTSLSASGIALLILASLLIAAAGNIINDIFDTDTDALNKPEKVIVGKIISEKTAYNLFILFNVVGVGLGYVVSNMINKSGFFALFIIISILLYVYASYLKQTFLIGNMVISALVAMSIIIVGVFDIIPSTTQTNQTTQWLFFKVILDYALFAFIINLIREIAKDMEDVDGDYKVGMRTLPIVLGRDRAKSILIVLSFIPLLGVIYYTISNLYKYQIATIYFVFLIVAPLLYICIKTFSAQNKKDYHHVSIVLKLVMLSGMLSLLLYKYIIL